MYGMILRSDRFKAPNDLRKTGYSKCREMFDRERVLQKEPNLENNGAN